MTKPLGQLSPTEKSEKPEKKETYWTSTEKESLKEQYGCEILVENGSPSDVMTKDAPSDASGTKAVEAVIVGPTIVLPDNAVNVFAVNLKSSAPAIAISI